MSSSIEEPIGDEPLEKLVRADEAHRTLADRLGMHRPELRAWALYDTGTAAFSAVILTAIFPIYYGKVASRGLDPATATFRYSIATTIALTIVALLSPFLGALADYRPLKKRLLGIFAGLGILTTAAMFLIGSGQWLLAAVLFVLANIGAAGAFVFYDALLPHIAHGDEMDRVSTAGYAMGYLGSGLLLGLDLLLVQKPAWFGLGSAPPTLPPRLAFVSVAVWWGLLMIPLFRRVPEPPIRKYVAAGALGLRVVLHGLAGTLRELRTYRNAFLFLLAFLIYNDGISTIIRMAGIYGTELGIGQGALIGSILLVQFIGIPCAFLFGMLSEVIGAKRSILLGLFTYGIISVLGYYMRTALHFFILAALVGLVQGGTQALSRSLFASMIPRSKAAEFFGFFSVFEKFAGILGPAVFAVTVAATGSSRTAILSVITFFAAGALLLWRVDVGEGRRVAQVGEAELAS